MPKPVADLARSAGGGLAAAKEFATTHPWIAAAGGVAVLAVGWSARRLWLPIAAAAAVERMLPGSTSAMSLDGLTKTLQQVKSQFTR